MTQMASVRVIVELDELTSVPVSVTHPEMTQAHFFLVPASPWIWFLFFVAQPFLLVSYPWVSLKKAPLTLFCVQSPWQLLDSVSYFLMFERKGVPLLLGLQGQFLVSRASGTWWQLHLSCRALCQVHRERLVSSLSSSSSYHLPRENFRPFC